MLLRCTLGFFVFLLFSGPSFGQRLISVPKSHSIERLDALPPGPGLTVLSLEAPDAQSAQGGMQELKRQAAKEQQPPSTRKSQLGQNRKTQSQVPIVLDGMKTFRVFGSVGIVTDLNGGTPNDNTLAVNNRGHVLIGVNSYLWGWDTENDTLLFQQSYINLGVIGQATGQDYGFDPKVAYDPEADRFVLVFLMNNKPSTSKVCVAFSKTNDPRDGWHVYFLPGNPLSNNRWTDFPAIALTENKLVLTANLIVPDVSWQVGFDGSIVWEMDKAEGYAGAAILPSQLHHNLRFNGKYTRNLYPLHGWNGISDSIVLVSNRNFSTNNDSVFCWTPASGSGGTGDHGFECQLLYATPHYGLPPNGRQSTTPINDPAKGMQTNDGRWLGGLMGPDGSLHVVSTTRTLSGTADRAAAYYGVRQPGSDTLQGQLIYDLVKDFAYPNIVFMGNEKCDREYLIGFNHTSPSHFPGVSAVYVGNDGSLSPVVQLKAGLGPVTKLGGAERWGDYFGLQRIYGSPNGVPQWTQQRAWLAGFFATGNGGNSTWLSLLKSPDSTGLDLLLELAGAGCNWTVQGSALGTTGPYTFFCNGVPLLAFTNLFSSPTFCSGDTAVLRVVDSRGCVKEQKVVFPYAAIPDNGVFPNPVSGAFRERVILVFTAPSEGLLTVDAVDAQGRIVRVGERTVRAGKNELSFDTRFLASGSYTLRAKLADKTLIYKVILVP